MTSDGPELSSIHSGLEEIAKRLTAIADRRDKDPDDPISTGLFEVERSIRNAIRQLDRVRNRLD